MFTLKKQIKAYTLSTIILFSICPLSAFSQSKAAAAKQSGSHSLATFAPKRLKVVQSSENIELANDKGDMISLPKYKKVLVDQTPAIATMSDQVLAGADIDISTKLVQEKLLEKKEMQELSDQLGIHINDASLLDFYREAADWLGTRYRRGGMSRKAVDCSGFTNIIYKNVFGKTLDRVSTVIAKNVKESIQDKDELEPGDLVFFSTFGKKYINHVGVYLGDGKFIHASIKHGVIVSNLVDGYYSRTWRKGGRV